MTLGALTQETQHPAAGYVAFAAIVMFLAALSLLPSAARDARRPKGLRLPDRGGSSREIVVREADVPEA
jgi:hypothetical protein